MLMIYDWMKFVLSLVYIKVTMLQSSMQQVFTPTISGHFCHYKISFSLLKNNNYFFTTLFSSTSYLCMLGFNDVCNYFPNFKSYTSFTFPYELKLIGVLKNKGFGGV